MLYSLIQYTEFTKSFSAIRVSHFFGTCVNVITLRPPSKASLSMRRCSVNSQLLNTFLYRNISKQNEKYGQLSVVLLLSLILGFHSSDYKNLQLLNGIMWKFINRILLKSAKKHGHYGYKFMFFSINVTASTDTNFTPVPWLFPKGML